jgi:hypothetical protein
MLTRVPLPVSASARFSAFGLDATAFGVYAAAITRASGTMSMS